MALAFTVGVFFLQQQASLFPLPIYIAALVCLLLNLIFVFFPRTRDKRSVETSVSRKSSWKLYTYQIAFGFAFGMSWAGGFAHYRLNEQLASNLIGQEFALSGVITSLPTRSPQGWHFQFQRDDVQSSLSEAQASIPHKLAVSWFDHPNNPSQFANLQPGQRWRLTLKLKPIHGNANPFGFDYEAWMLEQGVRASASVRIASENSGSAQAILINDFVWSPNNLLERVRSTLRERLHRALLANGDATYVGVLVALVIGDQSEISQSNWTIFNRTGIGHLVSISGLHITMIAGMCAACFGFLWRRSFYFWRDWPLLMPVRKVMVLSAALAALIYVALAGFGVPAQRTLYMLSVVALAVWTGRTGQASQILCLALWIVLLFDPWAVLWSGFWLSFAAVALLLYASDAASNTQEQTTNSTDELLMKDEADTSTKSSPRGVMYTIWGKLKQQLLSAARAQYAITMGLVPLTLFLFSQISLISPIANAIAIPLISFVVTPLALLGSVLPLPLAQALLAFAHATMSSLVELLQYLSVGRFAVWSAPQPTWWMLVLAILGLLWILAPRAWPARMLGAFCCLPMLVNPVTSPLVGQFHVTAFDVGQGTSLLIETAHHRLLYDSGPGQSDDSNSGLRVILPYMHGRGIHQLDEMVISHADSDHSGGALSLMKSLSIPLLRTSLAYEHEIVRSAAEHQRCVAGQSWEWDGVHFEILHPVPVIYTSDKWKTNARSCTLKISNAQHSLLLAGDIEAVQEDELVNSIPERLQASVLLVPHHGSGTSSTSAFVQAVHPRYALYQFGYLNRYRHPKPEVWQRYLDFGVIPLRTDTSGAITLQFGEQIQIEDFRQTHPRYWYPSAVDK
ncbi:MULTISPECIES: DNA internalization-related competence protein ComEC/Rec2 [Undibacterium]|nr:MULTISPECIES: DNA internalization-related competence protein ComEC/Rec2 [Undibacterium]